MKLYIQEIYFLMQYIMNKNWSIIPVVLCYNNKRPHYQMMWLDTCIGNWIISLCMWSWLTVWCLRYCNMSAGVMSVPSDLVLVACFITVWWTDSHSLYVFTLMGTYQAGPSPTKSHGEVSNTHLMWTEEESLNIYSIAPHINEFSSSWFFFLPMVAYLILLVAVERKL